jgi:tRNA A-37 threonylcarbamoyl transferase component Bud32
MGLRDLFRKLFSPDPYPTPDERVDAAKPPAPRSSSPPPRAEPDPIADLAGLPVPEAVRRVRVALDGARVTRTASLSLLRWLREHAAHSDLTATARVDLADFFLTRGERDSADVILRAVAAGPLRDAPPAMMRLGDLAAQSGDAGGGLGWYESALAVDLEYPGARERHARLKKPVRAGEAGATLLAPDASQALGRFELLRELGRGGAGAVYLARDKRVGREVALKLYHPQARADRNARLRGEAQVAAAVASPCVVRVHDLFEDTGALVMEHCAGGALRTRIARGTVDPREAHGWLRDVARALAHTHARRWVHRDLKPGNVLVRADGRAVLTDYGLARRAGQPASALEGTAGYVPPEARAGGTVEPTADTYAFGALMRDLVPGAAGPLAELMAACLADDPATRPRDGAALAARLG